ncbi:acetate/propionate family kinase [Maribacter cobaltidurans]|jgi:acetate kinase|uniref:Acetate kinase n=1 Tax=Maribacter cobaltidurans TaxID=1178778 RepID=A0A223V6P3_9FLAO|nr:acetate/propionate family kinase [Maribacter cobaltidurans]ASV30867.1 acetate kinase [Maribacter cobaltidurans]GGD89258.1 acetate kinase [Maribacter cobaltidurans]
MLPENTNLLTINGGSSSIKFAMYKMVMNPEPLFSGSIDRIGLDGTTFNFTYPDNDEKISYKIYCPGFYEAAIFLVLWLKKQPGFDRVTCIGHRIVHGLNHTHAEVINASLLKELKNIRDYDLDHLPAEIEIIELFKSRCPDLLQIACFDTSFHTTMPRIAKILPIPRRFDKAGIQRYGFHGLSYTYLIEELKTKMGVESDGRVILAHLGNGASMAAVKDGKSIDTTMGFTPTGGCVMGTRSGDLDPGVAWYMMNSEGMNTKQFNHLINHESGLLGISETSADMQDLLQKESSDERAAEAVALFCYHIQKWIGSFMAVLRGLDILVFSGGIGENAPIIRSRICEGLGFAGIELDEDKNNQNEFQISMINGKVKVLVMPTNEELIIARNTTDLYNKSKDKERQL